MERLTEKQLHILRQKLCGMKNRCYNPQNKFYKDYGGRGITVCSEWLDKKNGHKNFREWALENGWKEGYSIDRINVNGNYEPSNCRWSTPTEQANNRRNNNFVTINGVTKTTSEWAKQIGISQNAFAERVRRGWSEDKLLDPKYKPLKMTKSEMSKEIRMYRKLEEQGLLLRLPCKVGSTVYAICTCEAVGTVLDGTLYGSNGGFGTATGYYCPYELSDKCPHTDADDCDEYKNIEAVFEDTIEYINITEYEVIIGLKNTNLCVTIDEIGKSVFLTQAEAEKKLKEMESD